MSLLKYRTAREWEQILIACGVRAFTALRNGPLFAKVLAGDAFSAGEDELDDFLGHILHESLMLERLRENLNYSEQGLLATFGKYFTPAEARDYARQPERIANRVYANRMGNGDEASGDGWRYRGRAHIMGTGLVAYEFANKIVGPATGIDFVAQPDCLADDENALRYSLAWWEHHVPDHCLNDIVKTTRRVNGGQNGIEHRASLTTKATEALA